jgi:hypothetical protein
VLLAGRLGFNFRQGQEIFLYSTLSRLALGPIQPFLQWALGSFSMGVKGPARGADHSPTSSAVVKNGLAIPSLLDTSSWVGA